MKTATTTTSTEQSAPYGLFIVKGGRTRPATMQELRSFYSLDRPRRFEEAVFMDESYEDFRGAVLPQPYEDGSLVDVGTGDMPAELRGLLDAGFSVDGALEVVFASPTPPLTYAEGRRCWVEWANHVGHLAHWSTNPDECPDFIPHRLMWWRADADAVKRQAILDGWAGQPTR